MTYRIGFIGTGDPDGDGYAMAYRHAAGYERLDSCDITACADVVPENATRFAEEHGISERHVYAGHEEMLASADLDVVSVCVPPVAHADLVVDAAERGELQAIHCEKPMANTWGDARQMAAVCERTGTRLTINHQLRFAGPYQTVKRLVEEGVIGDLTRIELYAEDLYDKGTHAFDLANYYNDSGAVDWVLAQVDYTEENKMFGVHSENQGIAQWRYDNGVYGLAATGRASEFLDARFRLHGTNGVIELASDGEVSYQRDGKSVTTVDTGVDGPYEPHPRLVRRGLVRASRKVSPRVADRLAVQNYTERAIEAVISTLGRDEMCGLEARYALEADELIFASWESSRRRGRVDLPLGVDDNPLESMVESGELDPEPSAAADGAD